MTLRDRGWRTLLAVATAALVLGVVFGPLASAAPAGSGLGVSTADAAVTVPTVTWNGVNISDYSTASSAVSVAFNQAINVRFAWDPADPAMQGVNDARLAMVYLGFALSTRDVSPTPGPGAPSSATMNWSVGAIQYLVEGVFGVTASLLANGSTVWSQSFYVRLVAPFSILAALPLILLVLGAYELYALARSGRHAVPAKPVVRTPPPEAGSATPSPPGAAGAPTEPPPADEPPPEAPGGAG